MKLDQLVRFGACLLLLGSLTGAAPARTAVAPSLAAVDAELDRWLDSERIVGVVAVVERDGEKIYQRVGGLRDREAGLEMRDDTIFRIYSMTRPINCVAALDLCDQGKLGLDDAV